MHLRLTAIFILFPENFSVPPDVTATTSTPASSARPSVIDLPPSGIVKGMHKASNRSSLMDTADGIFTNADHGKEPVRSSINMADKAQQYYIAKLMSSILNVYNDSITQRSSVVCFLMKLGPQAGNGYKCNGILENGN